MSGVWASGLIIWYHRKNPLHPRLCVSSAAAAALLRAMAPPTGLRAAETRKHKMGDDGKDKSILSSLQYMEYATAGF